jgi:hypothetical protein
MYDRPRQWIDDASQLTVRRRADRVLSRRRRSLRAIAEKRALALRRRRSQATSRLFPTV